jgi:hypothetical protein
MTMAMLKEGGIDCYIRDEHTITIDPLLSPALGGMKLMVHENDLKEALSILDHSDQLYLQSVACPVCQQYSLQQIREIEESTHWWQRLKNILINGQENIQKSYYRCYSCGTKFDEI